MKLFLKYNESKIWFAFKFLSIIFLSICIIGLGIAYFNNHQSPNFLLLIFILIFAGIVFPFLLLFIAFVKWEMNRIKYFRLINHKNFNNLHNLGFRSKLLNENSKWDFTQEIKSIWIDQFEIDLVLEKNKIIFRTFALNENINGEKLQYFLKKLYSIGVGNFLFSYYIEFNEKDINHLNLEAVEIKLKSMTNLLIENNFKG